MHKRIKESILISIFCLIFSSGPLFAFEKIITVPAEESEGVMVELEKGEYVVEIAGGAITLFYPINPNYCWTFGVAVGTDVKGGQDSPNIGTLYFEPYPAVYSQAEAEEQVMQAVKKDLSGTNLKFLLQQDKKVRFWVSDFDYTDNSGMIKLKIRSVSG